MIPGHVPAFATRTARGEENCQEEAGSAANNLGRSGLLKRSEEGPRIRWIPPEDIAAAALLTVDQALARLPGRASTDLEP